MEDKILNDKLIDKNIQWLCQKCQSINNIDIFRCSKCNYFNYDVYSGNYQENNLKERNKKKVKKSEDPIVLEDKYIDYNEKEDYEFKREEKHKFIKCWHCGHENIYYKVKCNYCKFAINDYKEQKIKKTQLTQYDILHGITFDDEPLKVENKKKFREIEIKYNPIKEELKYNNLNKNWRCKWCKKNNNESIKFCSFCFKNRI